MAPFEVVKSAMTWIFVMELVDKLLTSMQTLHYESYESAGQFELAYLLRRETRSLGLFNQLPV